MGFGLFFVGYRLSQKGIYRDREKGFQSSFLPDAFISNPFKAARGIFTILGVFGLGLGLILFAETIITQEPLLGFLSGFVCIVGYLFGHLGLNGMLI